jgi:hypothetical protein
MKDKFKALTSSEKFAVRKSMYAVMTDTVDFPEYTQGAEEFEQTEVSQSNDDDIAAMEQFAQVWKMPDDEEAEESEMVPIPLPSPLAGTLDSISYVKRDESNRDSEAAVVVASGAIAVSAFSEIKSDRDVPFASASSSPPRSSPPTSPSRQQFQGSSDRDVMFSAASSSALPSSSQWNAEQTEVKAETPTSSPWTQRTFSDDVSSTPFHASVENDGALPLSPDSDSLSIYEDQESKELIVTMSSFSTPTTPTRESS